MADLEKIPSLRVDSHRTPNSWLTPTHISFVPHTSTTTSPSSSSSSSSSFSGRPTQDGLIWQSRRQRKGRYAPKDAHLHYPPHPSRPVDSAIGHPGTDHQHVLLSARLSHKRTRLKPGWYFDISWWLAFAFTLGSAIWVVNGFLVWFPILRPSLDYPAFNHAASATAFVGASVFEIGAYLGIVEVLVRGQEVKDTPLEELLHHRRQLHRSSSTGSRETIRGEVKEGQVEMKHVAKKVKGWVWWGRPMWHDMGYLAAIVQMFAATIFWVPCLTGLPGVIPGFADGGGNKAIIDVFYWTPQVIGGTGFIVSSAILLLEVQKKWYIPAWTDIGWHVAFWNLIGAVGFTLCGALGYSSKSGVVYQSALSTWWGSWGFMIGSTLQLAEASLREPGK